jgi:stage II sporulation protein M
MKRSKNKIKAFLEKNYSKSFSYLKESKRHIYGVIILFFVFLLIGFLVSLPQEFSSMILEYLRELVQKTEGFGFLEMFSFIFLNNSLVGFFSIVFGILFGIFPILSVISNGFILGYVMKMSVYSAGFSSLWRILPHGIFELPAIFISFGLGVKIGTFFLHDNALKKFKEYFLESLRVFVFIILPLLFIAGIIESLLIIFFG